MNSSVHRKTFFNILFTPFSSLNEHSKKRIPATNITNHGVYGKKSRSGGAVNLLDTRCIAPTPNPSPAGQCRRSVSTRPTRPQNEGGAYILPKRLKDSPSLLVGAGDGGFCGIDKIHHFAKRNLYTASAWSGCRRLHSVIDLILIRRSLSWLRAAALRRRWMRAPCWKLGLGSLSLIMPLMKPRIMKSSERNMSR